MGKVCFWWLPIHNRHPGGQPMLLSFQTRTWDKIMNFIVFFVGQESFLRKCLLSFPHTESTLFHQVVTQMSQVEVGESPTGLVILENAISGLSPFARSAKTDASSDSTVHEPCATCADLPGYGAEIKPKWCSRCHEVAYCSVNCQKLHWFTHKKYCPILKGKL